MKYATFHPAYNDVAPHFERMGKMLGLYSTSHEEAGEGEPGGNLGDTPPEGSAKAGVAKGR